MTTCPACGSGSGSSLMTRLSRPPNFSRTIARIKPLPESDYFERRRGSGCSSISLQTREKIADRRSDFVAVRFERKVAGIKETHFRARNVTLERLRALRQEEGIVLAPNREEGWPVPAEVLLKHRVKCDVALIVAEEIELDIIGAGAG